MNRKETRTRRWIGLVLLCFAFLSPLSATEPEDELRSATVLTFIRHAEWRESGSGPVRVGVIGRPDMLATLRRTLEGKTANNRAIQVVGVALSTDPRSFQVLYIAGESNLPMLTAWRSHALTIGESDRFLDHGGAVNLMIVNGHMHFEVRLDALDLAGVSISSKLLRYGQVIPGGPPRQPRPPA